MWHPVGTSPMDDDDSDDGEDITPDDMASSPHAPANAGGISQATFLAGNPPQLPALHQGYAPAVLSAPIQTGTALPAGGLSVAMAPAAIGQGVGTPPVLFQGPSSPPNQPLSGLSSGMYGASPLGSSPATLPSPGVPAELLGVYSSREGSIGPGGATPLYA
eukprot:gene6783-6477_t